MTRRQETSRPPRPTGWLVPAGTLVILLAAGRVAPASAPQHGGTCAVSTEQPRRLELADGRVVSLDVQSVATSDGAVMAVGRHGYVFPRNANPLTPPELVDSIIGVAIDARGNASLVSNPLRARRVLFPRVAAATGGAFHVLFVTGSDSAELRSTPMDSASIWYARYSHGAWTTPERVSGVSAGFLQPESAELLEYRASPWFLYPFVEARRGTVGGGVVLLRRRDGAWSADTLRTEALTPVARAVNVPGSASLLAAITMVVPRGGWIPAEELYVARFDSGWSAPRRVGGDGRRPVTLPALSTVGDTIVASWISWRFMRPESSRIEWLRLDTSGRVFNGPAVDAGRGTFPFELTAVDNRFPLWLYHGESGSDAVKLVLASGATLVRPASVTMPFENPKPKAIALTATRILLFTMKRGAAASEPMAASYTTVLEIRCPTSAQR